MNMAASDNRKTALITGCSRGGIGHALAIELQRRGLRVFATGRTLEKVADLKERGIECVALSVDDPDSVKACHVTVSELLNGKGLDYLFNNAGISVFRPATETDLNLCKEMFDANLFGIMNMCQTFLPQLLAAKGSIINMGSVAAHMPLPFFSNYAASKAALHAYSECMRVELAPLGVAVTYVMAGNVRTNELSTTRYQLDSSSLWYPVNDNFEKELHKAMTTGMEPADFAKRLADQTIERRRDTVWVGAGAVGCWFISALENWLPFRIWPTLFSVMYGMKRVGVHRQ